MPQRMPDEDRSNLSRLLLYAHERSLPLAKTGSQVIGGSTPESDWDYVIYSPQMAVTRRQLIEDGWTEDPSASANRATPSYNLRKGRLNIILVGYTHDFHTWKKATEIAKAYGPSNKEERVAIFDAVFGGYDIRRSLSVGGSGWNTISDLPEAEVSEILDEVRPTPW